MTRHPNEVSELRKSDPEFLGVFVALIPLGMWIALRLVYPPDFVMGKQLALYVLLSTATALGGLISNHKWWLNHREEICFDAKVDSAKHCRLLLWQVAALVGYSLPLLLAAQAPLPKFPGWVDWLVIPSGFLITLLRVVHFNWMRGVARESHFFRQAQGGLHAP